MKKLLSLFWFAMVIIVVLVTKSASEAQAILQSRVVTVPGPVHAVYPGKGYVTCSNMVSTPRPHRHVRYRVRSHIRPIRTKRYH